MKTNFIKGDKYGVLINTDKNDLERYRTQVKQEKAFHKIEMLEVRLNELAKRVDELTNHILGKTDV